MIDIALKSLRNRLGTVSLAVLAIAMSVALMLTVEKVRREARASFVQTVSGTDLIVGARSGAIPLLLYSVFHVGNATNNISWESVEDLKRLPDVDWVAPISLGDSHRGYRVVGTTADYFTHYRYSRDRPLRLAEGRLFDDVFDVVIGSEVARALNYALGQSIVVAHGTGKVAIVEHDKQPFSVSGILAPTGTPADRSLFVSLEGIEAMHVDWQSGMQKAGPGTSPDVVRTMDLSPSEVTAVLVGLTSRTAVFRVQRTINGYPEEPLLAILPGATLQELWSLVGIAENALRVVSVFVVLVSLINLVSVLLAGLNERRREMAILRAAGAGPRHVFALLCIESAMLSLMGILVGLALHLGLAAIGSHWLQATMGLTIEVGVPATADWLLLAAVLLAGTLSGCLPAWHAYRRTLSDGMLQRN